MQGVHYTLLHREAGWLRSAERRLCYYTRANWCSLPTQLSEEGGGRNSSRQARRREGGEDGGHFLTLSAFTLGPEEGFAVPESYPGEVLPLPWG